MDPMSDDCVPKTHTIRRSAHRGYGFVLGSEHPCMVKLIQPDGPSYGRLKPYDVILAINGINVEHESREKVIKMVQLSDNEIDITVRRASYEEQIRATSNLIDPRFYMNSNKYNDSKQNYSDYLSSSHRHHLSPPSIENASSQSQLNRLVTSISQQQPSKQYPTSLSNGIQSDSALKYQSQNYLTLQPDRSKNVLRQKVHDQSLNSCTDNNKKNLMDTNTLGRNGYNKFGRHSPLPQRCKSSIDDTQLVKNSKKTREDNNDPPLLKRSNTMRPIKATARVMEIFEVIIRVFFEDGHTTVVKYDQDTTVGSVLGILNNRLGSNSDQIRPYFGLAVTVNSDDKSDENSAEHQLASKKPFHILEDYHPIMGIRKLPYAPQLRLLYRMIYPPSNITELYNQNKVAFEYLYKQSCNDLRLERYSPPLDPETALKLSALFLVEYVYSNHPKAHGNSRDPKHYVRLVKKDPGLEHFVPRSMAKATKDKKGKRIIGQYRRLKTRMLEQLKKNFDDIDFDPPKVKATTNINRYTTTSFHELALPELQSSPSDHIKILFLNHLKQLPCYESAKRDKLAREVSPMDRNSVGDCSSSMESVPRTSDSSPLIRQPRNQESQLDNNGRSEQAKVNVVTRLAQINSMRSLSSLQPCTNGTNIGQHMLIDQTDMAQTPSIESISSVTFNTQSTPSPQHVPSHSSKHSEHISGDHAEPLPMAQQPIMLEPSPMPRHVTHQQESKSHRNNPLANLHVNGIKFIDRSVEELIKNAISLPPPSAMDPMYNEMTRTVNGRDSQLYRQSTSLTPLLTEQDLECLRVPPPPKLN